MSSDQHFVVGISGSPSPSSKTARLVDHLLARIGDDGVETAHVRLSALSPAALLRGEMDDPGVSAFVETLARANGVVIATPIFKAAYSGLLKAALDILPQFALAGKAVLPIGTGGSPAHVLALDYALRPVLQSMGARHIVQAHFVWENDMTVGETIELVDAASMPLDVAVHHFAQTLSPHSKVGLLGHPRPEAHVAASGRRSA